MHKQAERGEAPVIGPTEASDVKNPKINQGFNMSESTAVSVSSQPVFSFGERDVRIVVRDGAPWFAASDVCEVLAIKNFRDSVRHLDDDERGVVSTDTPARNQHGIIPGHFEQIQVVSESGLYALVLRSRKPEARKFAKWVTSEVLPAIRKTGAYVATPFTVNPGDILTGQEQDVLRGLLENAAARLPKEQRAKFMIQGWSKLKSHFGVSYREIPRGEFTSALSLVSRHEAEHIIEPTAITEKRETLNEIIDRLTRQVLAPNGYGTVLFMPLVNAVLSKAGFTFMLPPEQAEEISTRLTRLGCLFHPKSQQHSDVIGIGRALSGLSPETGAAEPGYRQVIERSPESEESSQMRIAA